MNTSIGFKKYIIIGVVVIVLIFIAVFMANTTKDSEIISGIATSSIQKNTTSPASTVQQVSIPSTKQTPVVQSKVVATNYVDYVTNLGTQRNICADAASKQYKPYATILERSAFTDYYNQKTGVCYAKITGTLHPAYSTTTGAIYFRNVTKNTPLAECFNLKDSLADGDWLCVDKSTGKNMSLQQFNGYISQLI